VELTHEPGNIEALQERDFELDNESKNKNLVRQELEMVLKPENTSEKMVHGPALENSLNNGRERSPQF
jgi:hypothetical protein